VIPARRGTMAPMTGMKVGSMIVDRTKTVQRTAASNGNVHPASKARTAAGADSVRRRLSIIFQRPIAGMAPPAILVAVVGARPKIHGTSCQSPLAQRWWRRAATS